MSPIPTQVAEVIQTAHINRDPSPRHDLNPSTAASAKEPARLSRSSSPSPERTRRYEDELDDVDDDEEIPLSILVRPREAPRRRRAASFPPMPDLRFEQSYLHSISGAETWGRVVWITVRDQIMMPLAQGVLYNLAIVGWQHWNRNAQMSGSSVGARLRCWWYGVNNWPLPARAKVKEW
ncbi:hypothetical protein EKO27_g3377 [Xylaria grammica]|uniref:DUF1770 domain-containing protein n=1 Tax=Xylaria grammica TaxID=363999 RepID=A0A439DBD9_9PEZI|nr:hypothetical protein EKO27_g3377 [Xylaria grammica]